MKSISIISNHHIIKNIGGAELQTDIIASSLADLDWNVSYITRDAKTSQKYKNYKLIPLPVNRNEFEKLLKNTELYVNTAPTWEVVAEMYNEVYTNMVAL